MMRLLSSISLCVVVASSDAAGVVASVVPSFTCGEVPRDTLVDEGLIPSKMADARCPRGQDGDFHPGETDPTELEFLFCGLVSTRKFVVWTPHFFVENTPELRSLLAWARENTTCDFSLADDCPRGFLLHHAHAANASRVRCLPDFDITTQPSKHALVNVAIKLFNATSADASVESLNHLQAEMAYGVVLGYPKFSTRSYLLTGLWKEEMKRLCPDFDASYRASVDWVLGYLEDCCAGTQLYEDIDAWPETTNSSSVNASSMLI